jgi:hypothetical protein
LIDGDQVRDRKKQRQGPSEAEKQEDRDMRREILRIEDIITGAERTIADAQRLIVRTRIDLEELYDRKKRWDLKFGVGEGTAQPLPTAHPEPLPEPPAPTIIVPSFPRPTIPIVDDDEDEDEDNDDNDNEQDVQDDQGNTEEQERRRLAKMFVRPGAKSVVAHNLPFLRLMGEIDSNIQRFGDDSGQARRLVRQFPLPPSTGDQAPPMEADLCQTGRDTWRVLDEILSKEDGGKAERYEECFTKWGSNRGKTLTPEIEARKWAEWGWWWARLLAESKEDTLDVGLWTRLIAIEKAKANQLPQPPRKAKR